MYCKFCGREIADDSKFCEFCGELVQKQAVPKPEPVPDIGEPIFKELPLEEVLPPEPEPAPAPAPKPAPKPAPEPEPEPEPKKGISKGLLWGLIGGGAALILAVVLILVFALREPVVKVDVSQYVDFKVSGYDGYGVATCELDTDGLERAALGEYPSGSDADARKKQTEYKEKAAILKSAVTLEFEKQTNVAVGTKLEAKILVDRSVEEELGIEFSTNLTVTYTVTSKDLGGSVEIDILDEFYELRFTGFDGSATAALAVKERKEAYTFTTVDGTEYRIEPLVDGEHVLLKFHNQADESTERVEIGFTLSQSENITTGTEVKVTLDQEAQDELMAYGLSMAESKFAATAQKLDILVSDITKLDKKTVNGWVSDYSKKLEKYVLANWNELLHGGNSLGSDSKEIAGVQCTNRLLASDADKNTLYLIFSANLSDEAILIDNGGWSKVHYFAVAIENIVTDADGKLRTEGLVLPSDDGDGYEGPYLTYDELYDATAGMFETVTE